MLFLGHDKIGVQIRPETGGRIDQITDIEAGKDWLWHPSGYRSSAPRSILPGAAFDPNWQGGWEEIFPNDTAAAFRGRELLDHGELWSRPWVVAESTRLEAKMRLQCQLVPVLVEKTITVHPTETSFRLNYLLQNQSDEELPFMFKQHPALVIEEDDVLLLPHCQVEPVALDFSRRIGRHELTSFPFARGRDGEEVRLDRMLGRETQSREFFYCSHLPKGRCGLANPRTGAQFLFEYDAGQFPFVWVFESFGGFYGHYVMVLEPSTAMPYDLDVACAKGTIATLRPRETRRYQMTVELKREPLPANGWLS